MSGPKCGSYQVVSAEEMRRRRLAAAKDRYDRATNALAALKTEIASANATYGAVLVGSARVDHPTGANSEEWEDAADALARESERLNRLLEDAVAKERVRLFSEAAHSVTTSLVENTSRSSRTSPDASVEEVARLMRRMPLHPTDEGLSRCEALERQWRQATKEAERDQVLTALRLVIQKEQDRARLVDLNRQRVESLYRELDGLAGETVETVRGLLKGLLLDQPLPSDLGDRVRSAQDLATAEQDRSYVLAAASDALSALGYDIDEEFRTAIPSGGTLIDLPHSQNHGLLIRERDQQLLMNIVRYDESGQRDASADTAAEVRFCEDFALLRDALGERGIEIDMRRSDPPGKTPVQVVKRAANRGRNRQRAKRPIERARDKQT